MTSFVASFSLTMRTLKSPECKCSFFDVGERRRAVLVRVRCLSSIVIGRQIVLFEAQQTAPVVRLPSDKWLSLPRSGALRDAGQERKSGLA